MTRWMLVATMLAASSLLAACGGGGDVSDEQPPVPSPVELTLPAAPAGRCMIPSVESLQAQDLAFEGVVTEVREGSAVLDVVQTFKGEDAEVVRVAVPDPQLRDLVMAVDFEPDRSYLVSSLEGRVSVCGLSGPRDEDLAELYEQAYGG